MMARRPLSLSWQNTTCSWPVSARKTLIDAPDSSVAAAFVSARRLSGGVLPVPLSLFLRVTGCLATSG
jgi:hypothetical protein